MDCGRNYNHNTPLHFPTSPSFFYCLPWTVTVVFPPCKSLVEKVPRTLTNSSGHAELDPVNSSSLSIQPSTSIKGEVEEDVVEEEDRLNQLRFPSHTLRR